MGINLFTSTHEKNVAWDKKVKAGQTDPEMKKTISSHFIFLLGINKVFLSLAEYYLSGCLITFKECKHPKFFITAQC